MELIEIYKCLGDETRLRTLHLLGAHPLCVCHFQEILRAPQVKISKHLAYLREHGMVETRREGTWMVYSLPAKVPMELKRNLKCLQDCCRESAVYAGDLKRMESILKRSAGPLAECCAATSGRKRKVRT